MCIRDRDRIQDAFHDQRSEEVDRRIAREAITLLKNEGNALPLSKDVKKIAVIGPHADRIRSLFGHYTYAAGIDMLEMLSLFLASSCMSMPAA